MSGYLIELTATVAQNSIIIYFLTAYLGANKKYTQLYALLFILILTIEATIVNLLVAVDGISILIPTATILIMSHLYLNGSFYKKLFSCLFIVALMAATGAGTVALMCSIFQTNIAEITTIATTQRLLLLVTANLLFLAASRSIILFSRINTKKRQNQHIPVLMIPLFSLISMYTLMEFVLRYTDAKTGYTFLGLLAVAIISINLFAYCIYLTLLKEQKSDHQRNLQIQAYEYQIKNHENIIQVYQETCRLRHDMKHQFTLIQSLLKNGHIADAENYLSSLIDLTIEHSPILLCDNEMINYVLNYKLAQCNKLKIPCSFQITTPLANLSESDLVLILSNLLDNAIEAEKGLPDPDIKVIIQKQGGYVQFMIQNRIMHSVLENNPSLLTSKRESKYHGYGIANARDLLSKHDGMMDFYESCGYFICRILFPAPVVQRQPMAKNDKV